MVPELVQEGLRLLQQGNLRFFHPEIFQQFLFFKKFQSIHVVGRSISVWPVNPHMKTTIKTLRSCDVLPPFTAQNCRWTAHRVSHRARPTTCLRHECKHGLDYLSPRGGEANGQAPETGPGAICVTGLVVQPSGDVQKMKLKRFSVKLKLEWGAAEGTVPSGLQVFKCSPWLQLRRTGWCIIGLMAAYLQSEWKKQSD